MRKKIGGLVVMILLIVCMTIPVDASGVTPRYALIRSISTPLIINGNTASCKVLVVGSSDVTRIQGTVELKDNSTGNLVGRWVVSGGSSLSSTQNATVTKGHSYTLSFAGFAYSNSRSEYVTANSSGTCK